MSRQSYIPIPQMRNLWLHNLQWIRSFPAQYEASSRGRLIARIAPPPLLCDGRDNKRGRWKVPWSMSVFKPSASNDGFVDGVDGALCCVRGSWKKRVTTPVIAGVLCGVNIDIDGDRMCLRGTAVGNHYGCYDEISGCLEELRYEWRIFV